VKNELILIVADKDVLTILAVGAQNNTSRRMAQLLDREFAVDDGNNNAPVNGINGAIDNQSSVWIPKSGMEPIAVTKNVASRCSMRCSSRLRRFSV
jgi:hypothetical protein